MNCISVKALLSNLYTFLDKPQVTLLARGMWNCVNINIATIEWVHDSTEELSWEQASMEKPGRAPSKCFVLEISQNVY